MTPKQRAEWKAHKLLSALEPLLGDTRFTDFLDTVKELKDEAVITAALQGTISNERTTLAALGEIRAYLDILGIAENYKLQIEADAERKAEEAALNSDQ